MWTIPGGRTQTGRMLVLPDGLPAGLHTLMLTATDSSGVARSASVRVLVGARGRGYLPWAGSRR